MFKSKKNDKPSKNNIYALDGKISVSDAIPFGLQHVLAMFVANIAPILIVSKACSLSADETSNLIQTAKYRVH